MQYQSHDFLVVAVTLSSSQLSLQGMVPSVAYPKVRVVRQNYLTSFP